MTRRAEAAREEIQRLPDHYRQAGMKAAFEWMDLHQTNAIARAHVVEIVVTALAAFEDEWARDSESKQGYTLVAYGKPVATLPTMSMARQQRRVLARLLEVNRLSIKIVETQYVV